MTYWQAGRVATNGIMLNYYRAGEGPSLVLLHGVTDNGMCWVPAADVLAADHDVILVDARGHGDSDKPPRGYTPDDHAADVAGLIEGLGLDRPILIGHSMGAQTAAVTAGLVPDLVRAAVLEDPPWVDMFATADAAYEWRQNMIRWIEGLRLMTQQEIVAQQRERTPDWPDEQLPHWAASKLMVSLDVFGDADSIRRPWQEVAPKIKCPALLITADTERGALVTWETAAEVARLENFQTVHIPGAGHCIRWDQPAAYLSAVRLFIDEVTRG